MSSALSLAETTPLTMETTAANSDADLLRLWNGGNMRGYNELIKRYEKPLFLFIVRMMRDAEESKDVLQETFVRLYQSQTKLKEDKNLKSWLFQTAKNLCIDHLRKLKPNRVIKMDHTTPVFEQMVEFNTPQEAEQPDQHLHDKRLNQYIRQAIADLPDRQRITMTLRSCKGLSLKEIAEVMNCSERTVGTTLFAARKRLRQTLQPLWSEMYGLEGVAKSR